MLDQGKNKYIVSNVFIELHLSSFNVVSNKQTLNMAQLYPLYDDLLQRVESRAEKAIDIKRVCKTINNISLSLEAEDAMEHYREIQALIIHYEILNNGGVILSSVPFDGKVMTGRKGILNHMMNLPPLLQQIIAQYVEDAANPESSNQ